MSRNVPTQNLVSKVAGSSRKTRIVASLAAFFALCAFGAAAVAPLAPDAADLPVKLITEDLPLPNLSGQMDADDAVPQTYISEEKVRPGDTLAALLTRLGVDDDRAAAFIKSDKTAHEVMQLKPGKLVQAQVDEEGQLKWLSAMVSDARNGDGQLRNIVILR